MSQIFRRSGTAAAVTLLFGSVAVSQVPDPLTDFQIIGKVYEPQAVSPTDERLSQARLAPGLGIHRFAEGLYNPRIIATAADGSVYVTQRKPGNLVLLKDLDRDGIADTQRVVARVKNLHGIAIKGRTMYLVDVNRVYASDLRDDGSLQPLRVISRNLPDAGQHPNRTLAFGPDGELYLSIGSTCNACDEPNKENATLVRVDTQTGKREIVATGLRNTIGFDWHPGSQRLYGMDHGIDWLGDDQQVEELNEIKAGKKYGWPFVYGEGLLNPQDEPLDVTQQEWAAQSTSPVAGYTAHAAPMQMRFVDRNSALIAMHGSWNRKPASGYEVIRATFNDSGDFIAFEPFLSGLLVPQPKPGPALPNSQPWPAEGFLARPVGIGVLNDKSALIGDDVNNVIYRVTNRQALPRVFPQALARQIVAPKLAPSINVTSRSFANGGVIPLEHTDYGEGKSPHLAFAGVPPQARSLVVMMEDPQATSPLPFVHWLAVLPAKVTQIPEGVPPLYGVQWFPAAAQGSNSRSEPGYFGPRPPAGDAPHTYHIQVFALDVDLQLPRGFNRQALLKAMENHVIAQGELLGSFAKQ